jgi:imidazolonepropionase
MDLVIVNCGQLATLAGPQRPRVGVEMSELGLIKDAALWIRDGRIVRAGRWKEIERELDPEHAVIDAEERVVLPGFIDAHTHFVFGGSRADEFERRALGETYQSIAASGGGILSTVRETRAASQDELAESALRRIGMAIRSGTTTAEVKSGYGLSTEGELKMLHVIRRLNDQGPTTLVPTFLGAHQFPEEFRSNRPGYIALIINQMLPRVAAERLAEYADIFCEPRIFDVETASQIMKAALAYGLRLRMHVDQLSRSGGAELAASLGATTADHLEHTDATGISALKEAGVQPVLLPGSVYALGSRQYPLAREMIQRGLAVVLATDMNPGSSPTPSIPMVISLAVTQMSMSVAEAINATTINAAYSLRRGSEVGSIEPGKIADVVIHDCYDYRDLGYLFGIEYAHQVFVKGKCIYARSRGTRLVGRLCCDER